MTPWWWWWCCPTQVDSEEPSDGLCQAVRLEAGEVVVGDVEGGEGRGGGRGQTAVTPPCQTAGQESLQVGRGQSGPGQAQTLTVEPGTGQQ